MFLSYILFLIHFLVNVYSNITRSIKNFFTKQQDLKVLLNSTKQLTKVPRSIAFACPSEDVLKDTEYHLEEKLIQLMKWCAIIGIPYISIYDDGGEFIARKGYLEQKLKYLHRLPETEEDVRRGRTCNTYMLRVQNGFRESFFGFFDIGTHSVKIHLMSRDDGRRHMADIAKDHVGRANHVVVNNNPEEVDVNAIPSQEVDLEGLEKRVRDDYDFPDPEIIVQLSDYPCLFGFLPWQVRLSEIISLPDCDAIGDLSGRSVLQAFTNVLFRYSKCEQRFGT